MIQLAILYPLFSIPYADFLILFLILFALGQASGALAKVVGAISASTELALICLPLIFVPQVLFSGAFVNLETIPEWIRWAQWLCMLKYGVNLAATTVLTGVPGSDTPEFKQLLAQQDIDPSMTTRDAVILCALWVVFELLACFSLLVVSSSSMWARRRRAPQPSLSTTQQEKDTALRVSMKDEGAKGVVHEGAPAAGPDRNSKPGGRGANWSHQGVRGEKGGAGSGADASSEESIGKDSREIEEVAAPLRQV